MCFTKNFFQVEILLWDADCWAHIRTFPRGTLTRQDDNVLKTVGQAVGGPVCEFFVGPRDPQIVGLELEKAQSDLVRQ